MDINNLVLYSEPLYKIAYKKLNNTVDADELTQETLLQALIELRKNPNKVINNEQAWLNGILNNCYYTMMRKKYKISYVTFDVVIENLLFDDNINDFIDDEETREVHNKIQRAVSGLAKIHRDVIYMFYMQNKSVNQIAEELNIPRGTVLSRLDNGRKMIKKGVDKMNKNIMYQPQKLNIGMMGNIGDNGQPFTDVSTSIHQNILILAYEKPITESEISEKMSIPCVYIEEIVDKLIEAELMKRTSSGKIYTDFYIEQEKNILNSLDIQLEIVNNNFELIWKNLSLVLDKIESLQFVSEMNERKRNKLLTYVSMRIINNVVNKIRTDYHGRPFIPFNEYPDRPNKGKWIALGTHLISNNYYEPYKKYLLNGIMENSINYKDVYISCEYFRTSVDNKHKPFAIKGDITKLLYNIANNDITGDIENCMEEIPFLCEIGVLDNSGGTTKVDIPQLNKNEKEIINDIVKDNELIYEILKQPVIEMFKKQHSIIPTHLKESISQELLTIKCDVLNTGFLVHAVEKGLFLNGVDYPCPAMIFVTE